MRLTARLIRLPSRAVAVPVAAGVLVIIVRLALNLEVPYVLAYGERYPADQAIEFGACHDLAYPQIRCFDTLEELVEDELRGWPQRGDEIRRVLETDSARPSNPANPPDSTGARAE